MALEAQEIEKKSSGVKIRVDTAVDEYMSGGDNRSENANMGVTPNGLLFTVGGLALNRDNLKRLEDAGFSRLVELHRTGGVHIHDLSLGYCTPYCIGLSLENLIVNGLNAGPVPSAPAKHFRTVVNHIVNCIGSVCNEVAGAIAFNDIDVYLGAYAYKYYLDKKKQGVSRNIAFKLTKEEIKQSLQELVFHLNQTNRFGGQTPFSNITLAMRCPDDMKDREAIIGDKRLIDCFSYHDDGIRVNHTTYGELEEWQSLVASVLLDVYIEGSHDKRGFTFPVLTINVTNDFLDSQDIAHIRERVWKLTAKYGTPFFQNFVSGVTSIDKKLSPKDVRSMCCRLSLDLQDLRSHTGGLFGNGDSTGSLQVVTVSLPFLARHAIAIATSNGESHLETFFKMLDEWMYLIKAEQLWKREVVNKSFEDGFFPMCAANLPRKFETFFTTIGFVGVQECVSMLLGDPDGIVGAEGLALGAQILTKMKGNIEKFISETGTLFNLEATPAESASHKLAKKALKMYPDIDHRGLKKAPYFTNSHTLPVELQDDLGLVFKTQSVLQTIPSGGTVQHFYITEDMSPADVEEAVRMICDTKIPYFGLSMVYSVCPICGRVPGAHETCPNTHTLEQLEELKAKNPALVLQ